jgi:hypothetical protein|uniref:Uncharacterized protein n=1 Tax=viral metagenome TaxID=1070528 RepID=A0A6C0IP10_9ZZZZ
MTQPTNIKYTLKEFKKKPEDSCLSFDELEEFIENREKELNTNMSYEDDNYSEMFFIMEEEYSENYTKKGLEFIADYYGINKRRKRKGELIQEIIIFEQNDLNYDVVEKRKLHWFYLDQLKSDPYLKQYITINN